MQNFTGEKQGNSNILYWKTSKESKGDFFDLQRSTDGKNYETISTVYALGKASDYKYVDANIASGNNYYRLQNNSIVGAATYSNTILLSNNAKETTFDVYPNPAKEQLNIHFYNAGTNDKIALYDMTGKKVLELNANAENIIVNVKQYNAGTYMLVLVKQNNIYTKTVQVY